MANVFDDAGNSGTVVGLNLPKWNNIVGSSIGEIKKHGNLGVLFLIGLVALFLYILRG